MERATVSTYCRSAEPSSSGGVPTAFSVTKPNIYGCATTTSATFPQLSTTGSGTGLVFSVTVLFPVLYGTHQLSTCYSGPLLNVQNSQTLVKTDIYAASTSNPQGSAPGAADLNAIQQAIGTSTPPRLSWVQ